MAGNNLRRLQIGLFRLVMAGLINITLIFNKLTQFQYFEAAFGLATQQG